MVNYIFEHGPCTTTEYATTENLNIGLIDEMVKEVEMKGSIVRDDLACVIGGTSGSTGALGVEVRWWENLFTQYVWDGE